MADVTAFTAGIMPTVKVACRAMAEEFEPELQACVLAAISDMLRAGVSERCLEDGSPYRPLVVQAAIVYSKAHFGQDNPNAEMGFFLESYDRTVKALLNSAANSAAEAGDAEPGGGLDDGAQPDEGGDGE